MWTIDLNVFQTESMERLRRLTSMSSLVTPFDIMPQSELTTLMGQWNNIQHCKKYIRMSRIPWLSHYTVNVSDTHLIMTSYLQKHRQQETRGLSVFCSGRFLDQLHQFSAFYYFFSELEKTRWRVEKRKRKKCTSEKKSLGDQNNSNIPSFQWRH